MPLTRDEELALLDLVEELTRGQLDSLVFRSTGVRTIDIVGNRANMMEGAVEFVDWLRTNLHYVPDILALAIKRFPAHQSTPSLTAAEARLRATQQAPDHGAPDPTEPARCILVAGSGGVTPRPPELEEVSRRVGAALASAGWCLVTCGWDGVDGISARAFATQLAGKSLAGRIVQFLAPGHDPELLGGEVVETPSDEAAWLHSIERSDAVVLIGGLGGTKRTGLMALDKGKPVFPLGDTRSWNVPHLHADAYNFLRETLRDFQHNPASARLSVAEFADLGGPTPGVVDSLMRLLRAYFSDPISVSLPHATGQSPPNTEPCAISFAAGSSFRSAANLVARTYRTPPPTLIGFTEEELSTRIRTGQINVTSATDGFLGLLNLSTSGAVRPYDVRSDPGNYVLIVREQP